MLIEAGIVVLVGSLVSINYFLIFESVSMVGVAGNHMIGAATRFIETIATIDEVIYKSFYLCGFRFLSGIPASHFGRWMRRQLTEHDLINNIDNWLTFIYIRNRFWRYNINRTKSSSLGTRDNRSNTSLFGTECGRTRRRENLTMPQSNNRILIGTKCNTKHTRKSNSAANQLSSGTEKLNVLQVKLKEKLLLNRWIE